MWPPRHPSNRVVALAQRTVQHAGVSTALRALGATFELVSEHSPDLQAELAAWEEGRVLTLGVLSDGPVLSLQCTGGRIRSLGAQRPAPTIALWFKNLDAAFVTFTGQIGAHTASIEHRVIVHGNIAHAMQAMRALNLVQRFLLPAALLNLTAKRPVHLSAADLRLKARILAELPVRLARTWSR